MSSHSGTKGIDLSKYPHAAALVETCKDFFAEVQDLTPGQKLEEYLNANYGPGTQIYDNIARIIRQSLEKDKDGNDEGWCATIPISSPNYRRLKLCLPSEETKFFSITTVYMNSQENFRGQYHKHPYGEINCIITLDKSARLKGMSGFQGDGWTSPGPGTHHYPEVEGGALVSLFFLPAGRIAYDAKPGEPQPVSI